MLKERLSRLALLSIEKNYKWNLNKKKISSNFVNPKVVARF